MITDEELKKSLRWYLDYYGKRTTAKPVFETWLIGRFHTYPKAAREILEKMIELELVKVVHGMVKIL